MTTTAACSPTSTAIDDGLFVNEAIVRRGYATPLTIEPNDTFAAQFVAAAKAAEGEGLGLWTACAGR